MKIDILLFCPLTGNGGIAIWANNLINDFSDNDYHVIPVDIAPGKDSKQFCGIEHWYYGTVAMLRALRDTMVALRHNPHLRIMHIATSIGLGALRNYFLGKCCKFKGLKLIMHCHFGSVKQAYEDSGIRGLFFRKSLCLYDQIWVLTHEAELYLNSIPNMRGKVVLMPNFIEVPQKCNIMHREYKHVGFVGNLIPQKGIYELVEAVVKLDNDTKLLIAGKGTQKCVDHIKDLAGIKYGRSIQVLGWLSNKNILNLIEELDIVALPTYYPIEAFPISILEAMSRGKLVISCRHAAIPDMLTNSKGESCGIMVKQRNVKSIMEAILWCQNHRQEANVICKNAYEKTKDSYSKEIIFKKYKETYINLVLNN